MKYSDKPLPKEAVTKLQLLSGIELNPQKWELVAFTTALISRYKNNAKYNN